MQHQTISPVLWLRDRTVAEAVEISQDVARKLIESYREHGDPLPKGLRPMNRAVVELDVPIGV